jgi:hypothetical protein
MNSPLDPAELNKRSVCRMAYFSFVLLVIFGCTTSSVKLKPLSVTSVEEVCPHPMTTTVLPAFSTKEVYGHVLYHASRFSSVDSDSPMSDVTVVMYSGPFISPAKVYVTSTADNGRFSFDHIPPGAYTLRTCLDGFDAVELSISVQLKGQCEELALIIRPS